MRTGDNRPAAAPTEEVEGVDEEELGTTVMRLLDRAWIT
jgi:hypothetical protein